MKKRAEFIVKTYVFEKVMCLNGKSVEFIVKTYVFEKSAEFIVKTVCFDCFLKLFYQGDTKVWFYVDGRGVVIAKWSNSL